MKLLPVLDLHKEAAGEVLCEALISDTLKKFHMEEGSYESIRMGVLGDGAS